MLTKCGSQSEGYNWAKLICTKDATDKRQKKFPLTKIKWKNKPIINRLTRISSVI